MSFNIEVESGNSVRLPTAGKYCDRDIVVTAFGGSGGSGGSGWVVCEEAEVTKATTIEKLQGVRLSLPNAESIGNYAFYDCTALTSVDLPVATSIGDYAFYDCIALTSVDLPVATSIGGDAFRGCTALTSVDLPVATSIGSGAFYDCIALTSVDLPVATSVGVGAFYDCIALTSVDLPVATSIGDYAFYDCIALTSVDLPVATSIGETAFYNCTNLSALILRNTETVCQLIITAVINTKIATAEGAPTGEGFIYVPTALYEGYVELIAYQAAQLVGDAATAEYIARAVLRKIEDYPEICG